MVTPPPTMIGYCRDSTADAAFFVMRSTPGFLIFCLPLSLLRLLQIQVVLHSDLLPCRYYWRRYITPVQVINLFRFILSKSLKQ